MAGRILVAVDSPEPGTRMLEAAARLAERRRAELVGLYVEESAFLDLADFPFSKTLRPGGGAWEPLDPDTMQRAFRARAEELERLLADLARRRRVSWRFQADRGVPAERLLASAGESDILVLSRSRGSGGARTGSTARRALARSHGPVMVLDPALSEPARVTAVYEGDPNVLVAADELARAYDRPLEVLVVADQGREAEVSEWLRRHGWPERVRHCPPGRGVADVLTGRDPGITVVASRDETELAALVDTVSGPVMVVR